MVGVSKIESQSDNFMRLKMELLLYDIITLN